MATVPSSSGSSSSFSSYGCQESTGVHHNESIQSPIKVQLEDHELWRIFSKGLKNEMIITKAGRRMFPVVRARVRGLDPRAMYNVVLEFVQNDDYKWKYTDGQWHKSGKAEPQPASNSYVHPDSPNFGEKWMRDPILFSKLKFTNKDNAHGWVLLNSMHHYQPTIKLYRIDPNEQHDAAQVLVARIPLLDCQFIAVTSYQNEEVTELKIKHNPFAKGFQENSRSTLPLPLPIGHQLYESAAAEDVANVNLSPQTAFSSPYVTHINGYPTARYNTLPPSAMLHSDNHQLYLGQRMMKAEALSHLPDYRNVQLQPQHCDYYPPPPPISTTFFCASSPPSVTHSNFDLSRYSTCNNTNNFFVRPAFVPSTSSVPLASYAPILQEDQSYTTSTATNRVPSQMACTTSNGHCAPLATNDAASQQVFPTNPDHSHYGYDNLNWVQKRNNQQPQYCLPFVGGSNAEGVVGKFTAITSSALMQQQERNRYHPYAAYVAPRVQRDNKHNKNAPQRQQHQICATSVQVASGQQHERSESSVPGSSLCGEKGSADDFEAAREISNDTFNDVITAKLDEDANKNLAAMMMLDAARRNSSDAQNHDDTCIVHSQQQPSMSSAYEAV